MVALGLRVARSGVVTVAVAASLLAGAHATTTFDSDLDRLAATYRDADTSDRGMHSDFTDNPIGRFMDLLAAGAIREARTMQAPVCASWNADRSHSALTGRFSVQGTDLSLDHLCALDRETDRQPR